MTLPPSRVCQPVSMGFCAHQGTRLKHSPVGSCQQARSRPPPLLSPCMTRIDSSREDVRICISRGRSRAGERPLGLVGAQVQQVASLRLRALPSSTNAPIGRRCDSGRMTAWQDVERAEPEFARRVRELFDAHRHKTVATLRGDGAPRISGIEATFEYGELAFGSMPNARKGADLRRDPRFALHSATVDPVEGSEAQWPGEAKISGRATHVGPTTEGPDGDRFYADIAEVVRTHLNVEATKLVVEWWTPTQGLRRIERE